MQYDRPRDGAALIGVSLSQFWLLAKTDPDFPDLIKLGPKTTVVRREDLIKYVENKPKATRAAAKELA